MKRVISQVSLNPSAIARVLGAVAFLLLLASSAGQFSKFVLGHDELKGTVRLFYFDAEANIPTYFSQLLLLFAALLLAIIAVVNRKQKIPHVWNWALLSFGFLFQAYDETFEAHERLIGPVRDMLGGGTLGIFYFAWVIPAIALVLVLGLLFLRFLLYLPAHTRLRFLVAASLFLAGAIGFELIGGRYAEVYGQRQAMYAIIATIEESLEMAGLLVFIWALLKYCEENYEEVRFRFEQAG